MGEDFERKKEDGEDGNGTLKRKETGLGEEGNKAFERTKQGL